MPIRALRVPHIVPLGACLLLSQTGHFALPSAIAADPPPSPTRPPGYPTLAAALAEARPLEGGAVALCVDAEHIKPPKVSADGNENLNLSAGSPVPRIARRFERSVRVYGSVMALAPPTMVLINNQPGKPNIYIGMPMDDVLTILLDSLNDGQWQAATSESGLPVSALTTDDQRMLMKALLPHEKLTVAPWYSTYHRDYKPEDIRDLSGSLGQARLRLSQSYSVGFPAEGEQRSSYQSNEIPPPPDGAQRYKITDREIYGGSQDSLYGVLIRNTVRTTEKPGQLSFEDPRLQANIPLTDLKTVGDLMARIGAATGLELYADPHYAGLRLTAVGGATARASDLLRAVALCATATVRRVGAASEPHPAYVLTDDLVGMGTRQAIWHEFELDGDALRGGPITQAAQSLYKRFGPRSVKAYGEDAAVAPATKLNSDEEDEDGFTYISKPYTELSSNQQTAVQRVIDTHNRVYKSQPGTINGTINLYPQIRLQMLLPSLPTPLDMNLSVGQTMLFRVPKAFAQQRQADQDAKEKVKRQAEYLAYLAQHPEAAKNLKKAKPAPAAATAAQPPRRAVLLSPSTVAELQEGISAMRTLALNELWLDLPFSRKGQPATNAETLLTEAIRATEKTGIRVYPVLSPLAEDTSPQLLSDANPSEQERAEAKRDRNFLGETSSEAERHLQERAVLFRMDERFSRPGEDEVRPIPPVYSDPLNADFRAATEALVRRLARTSGVAGLVWKQTDPPGYDAVRGGDDMSRRLLGYSPSMRLAFLRQFHADPVDLYTPNYYAGKADTSVPFQTRNQSVMSAPYQAWKRFRREQNLAFLRTLYAAAGSTPILIKQRREGPLYGFANDVHGRLPGWYGSWDDLNKPLPTFHTPGDDADLGRSETGNEDQGSTLQQARQQSKVALDIIPVSGYLQRRHYSPKDLLNEAKQPARLRDDGFVLDLSAPNLYPLPDSDDVPLETIHTLADLAARLSAKPAP